MRRYLEYARREAETAPFYQKQKHGAVLVKGGSILNKSFNNPNFSSFMRKFTGHFEGDERATRHAELMCILGLERSVTRGSTIYIVRVNNHGSYRLSRPCSLCQAALKFVGVKKAVYSINNEQIGIMKLG
jgi:tRNA(Arg) A34 adenosine deaminase TadA